MVPDLPDPASRLPALPADLVLHSERLRLEPVTRAHADELAVLLADDELFTWTGRPAHLGPRLEGWLGEQERRRSPSGSALWLTWAVRASGGGPLIGQSQATVSPAAGPAEAPQAELSWLLARTAQGRGLATEAAAAVTSWLRRALGVRRVQASIAPGHLASERVAERLGLRPNGEVVDGERRWSSG